MKNSSNHLCNGCSDAKFCGALASEDLPAARFSFLCNGIQIKHAIAVRPFLLKLSQGFPAKCNGGPRDHLALSMFSQRVGMDGFLIHTGRLGQCPAEAGGIQCRAGR